MSDELSWIWLLLLGIKNRYRLALSLFGKQWIIPGGKKNNQRNLMFSLLRFYFCIFQDNLLTKWLWIVVIRHALVIILLPCRGQQKRRRSMWSDILSQSHATLYVNSFKTSIKNIFHHQKVEFMHGIQSLLSMEQSLNSRKRFPARWDMFKSTAWWTVSSSAPGPEGWCLYNIEHIF